MHGRQTASGLSVVKSKLFQLRSSSTAVKLKPRTWDIPETVNPPPPNLGKWALQEPHGQMRIRDTPDMTVSPSPKRVIQKPHLNTMDRSRDPPLFSGHNKVPVRSERPFRPNRPSSSSIPSVETTQRRPYVPRSDPRLQRDMAPHQSSASLQSARANDYPVRMRGDAVRREKDGPRYAPNARYVNDQPRVFPRGPVPADKAHPYGQERSINMRPQRTGRHNRDAYKSRGSLLGVLDTEVSDRRDRKANAGQMDHAKEERRKQRRVVRAEIFIPTVVSVGNLARLLNVRLETLQRKMRQAGMGKEASYDYVLTSDYAILLAEEFGRKPVVNDEAAFDVYPPPPHRDPSTLPSRPPIVTIMGHVDHGKTTLLDRLRSTSVAQGEAGGITQHIGAFSVEVSTSSSALDDKRIITFLDTPGHSAFSAMRARGADVTDMVVLVVAADDGVMPQTREVIELVQKDEKLGLVVAINKVDKPDIDIGKLHLALMAEGVQLEALGGDVPSVEVSGLTGQGLDNLVETLYALAEMQDLRAEREGLVHGYVLESKIMKGLGPVATVLVLRGCLTPASYLICGTTSAKVRVITDSAGTPVKAAFPGMAVTVSGWRELPLAGDEVLQGKEADIKKAVANRTRKAVVEATLVDVEAINANRQEERERKEYEQAMSVSGQELVNETTDKGPKELRLVIKGDVSGSVEALEGAVQGIGNKEVIVKIVSSGVGNVTESDIMMAKTVEGMIVAFSVTVPRPVEILAVQNNVLFYSSTIIYRVMDEVKRRLIAMLPPIIENRVTGEATVLQIFDIHLKAKQIKKVAGCRVTNGILDKVKRARVIRNGVTIHDGTLDTLKVQKSDTTEVRKGAECGLSVDGFEELCEGDLIQVYHQIKQPAVL